MAAPHALCSKMLAERTASRNVFVLFYFILFIDFSNNSLDDASRVGRPGTAADEERQRHVHHHLQYQSSAVISCPSTSPSSPATFTHTCRPASGVRGNLWLKPSMFIPPSSHQGSSSPHILHHRPAFNIVRPVEKSVDLLR